MGSKQGASHRCAKKEYTLKKRIVLSLVLCSLLTGLLCSCFSSQRDEPYRGNRDGIEYLYLEDRALMIVSGQGVLKKSNRICTVSYFQKAEYLFVAAGVEEIEEGIFSEESLKGVYCAAEPELEEGLSKIAKTDVESFEEAEDLPFSPVGHCPSEIKDECLICTASCYYEYLDLSVRFCLRGKLVKGESITTEGKQRTFNEEGILQTEGFDFLSGAKRYFRNNRMITGSADIDGVRYNFSNEGELHSSRPLDTSVSPLHVILIIAAAPLGAAISYGVYLIYKKKNAD